MRTLFITFAFIFCCLYSAQAQTSRKVKFNPVTLGLDLPDSYRSRTFIKGLAGFVNNIDQLVGSMIDPLCKRRQASCGRYDYLGCDF
jgi:hypothetical protein